MPQVSVIIPLYNAAPLIGETLDSVVAQTFEDWEAVVVDDGSVDGSGEVVRRHPDSRIRLLSQANEGASAARNHALAAAAGEWLAFLDADDIWTPGKLSAQLAAAAKHHADLVFGPVELFGAAGKQREYPPAPYILEGNGGLRRMLQRNHLPTSTVLARASSVESAGGFDESARVAEDYDLWMRMLLGGARMVYDPQSGARYRLLAGSLSAGRARMRQGTRRVLSKLRMPTWSLEAQRRWKMTELLVSHQRHRWRERREKRRRQAA